MSKTRHSARQTEVLMDIGKAELDKKVYWFWPKDFKPLEKLMEKNLIVYRSGDSYRLTTIGRDRYQFLLEEQARAERRNPMKSGKKAGR